LVQNNKYGTAGKEWNKHEMGSRKSIISLFPKTAFY
jgi:hypothetical protein